MQFFSKNVTSLIWVKPLVTNRDLCRVTWSVSPIVYLKVHLHPMMCVWCGKVDVSLTSQHCRSRSFLFFLIIIISRSHASSQSLASGAARVCL